MGEAGGRVHVVTGPNSSGKSVYMKQAGLIVYLAHVGCWVPASRARIPLTNKLFTRIQTVESVSLGLSAFLCDVNQASARKSQYNNPQKPKLDICVVDPA
jgi:DNA mismatch repair protein MSH5